MLQHRPEPPRARVGNHLRQLIVDEEGAARAASDAKAVNVRGPDVGEVGAERAGIAAEGHSINRINRDATAAAGIHAETAVNVGAVGPKLRPDADFVLSFPPSGDAHTDRANSAGGTATPGERIRAQCASAQKVSWVIRRRQPVSWRAFTGAAFRHPGEQAASHFTVRTPAHSKGACRAAREKVAARWTKVSRCQGSA